jgi:hypothetical protein
MLTKRIALRRKLTSPPETESAVFRAWFLGGPVDPGPELYRPELGLKFEVPPNSDSLLHYHCKGAQCVKLNIVMDGRVSKERLPLTRTSRVEAKRLLVWPICAKGGSRDLPELIGLCGKDAGCGRRKSNAVCVILTGRLHTQAELDGWMQAVRVCKAGVLGDSRR